MFPLTPWVRRLLVANVVITILGFSSSYVRFYLILIPELVLTRPWTVLSYAFLHGGWAHLFFNMLGLFFFGPRLESRLGSKAFLALYVLAAIGGGVLNMVFQPNAFVVGASGAVYGVLAGFAHFWPRERIYIWGVLPIEAWLLAVLVVILSITSASSPGSRIAHFAHLGGLAIGYAYVRWWEWRTGAARRAFQKQLRVDATTRGLMGDRVALARWKGIDVARLHELNRGEVERLLAKAEQQGPSSLTDSERDFLDRMSAR